MSWWTEHPAYQSLVDCFTRAHVNNGTHLAFVVLTGIEGYELVEKDRIERYRDLIAALEERNARLRAMFQDEDWAGSLP